MIDGKETMNDNGQSVRCAAIIQSGERCKLQAQAGSAYCYVHLALEAQGMTENAESAHSIDIDFDAPNTEPEEKTETGVTAPQSRRYRRRWRAGFGGRVSHGRSG